MASYDSIVNVDEWISDHYLTNDETKGESFGKRAAAAVKAWKDQDKALTARDGKSAPEAAKSPWARLGANRETLLRRFSVLDAANPESVAQAAEEVEAVFGFPTPREVTVQRDAETVTLQAGVGTGGTAMVVRVAPIESMEQLVDVSPVGGVAVDGKEQPTPAMKLVTELFLADEPPAFVVLLAGAWVVVAERESWPLGRYLCVNVALAAERNERKVHGELEQVVAALAFEHIDRAADGSTWWEDTLAESRDHAVKVSSELRQAIKESIEIIGNDVLERYRAQGLPTDGIDGNELAKQALRYLYRILFLLFAEATPELNILPTGVPEYDDGYGLTHLREQVLVPPATERAAAGTYLYDSLDLLFEMVNQGHEPPSAASGDEEFGAGSVEEGLTFRNLSADLFLDRATSYVNVSKLSNAALQKVLENLLLTRESRGKDRGFISYATLGVAQLGQVYEGLMSYTGFIAQETLLEVAPKGDPSKGSWVVGEELAKSLPQNSFVQEVDPKDPAGVAKRNRRHPAGSFVFRQSSRDRERSASFYSPPVITEFTVGQAIEVLRESGRVSCADDVLSLTVCEPAMGSGAFAVEAVNQLADLYLELKQDELGERIDPGTHAEEVQKVRAAIALHRVYGVDLNATAVELAEISLWLDTMSAELKAPWFGLHLRRGNSLIGATRATVTANSVKKREYLTQEPTHHPVSSVATSIETGAIDPKVDGRIHHFLVPSKGWGAAADAKELNELAADQITTMKTWRKDVQKGFTAEEVKTLQNLSRQVEKLWQFALARLRIAEDQVSRDITVWGQQPDEPREVVTREAIEAELFDNMDGAYQRLRLVMDAWNALWFWPITEADQLPDHKAWLTMVKDALGTPVSTATPKPGQYIFASDMSWDDLGIVEDHDRTFSGRKSHAMLLEAHPWLRVALQVAEDQGFFHWDLDFASVMEKGGFDFQVGNPPWVRPRTDVDALLSEHDPWFSLAHKPTQAEKKARRAPLADDEAVLATLARGLSDAVVTSAVLGDETRYPHLKGQQPDLYRGFMERTWANAADDGVVALIHPESHFTEKKAAPLRAGAYRRLRRHWQFINELVLFDIDHHNAYGIHIYGTAGDTCEFISATQLYHPKTVVDSLRHDGTGPLPGLKDDEGKWDLRPHRDRIITVDERMLKLWHSILEEPGTPLLATRTVYTVNTEASHVLAKLAAAPRMKELGLQFSSGWHETGDKKKGYFDTKWQHPGSWADAILQGPHLGVSTPMIKQPNPTMKNNQDWSEVDFEAMSSNFIPATAYRPNRDEQPNYDSDYGFWDTPDGLAPVKGQFRLAWRAMAATTGFRTFYPAIIPPGAQHVHGVHSAGPLDRTTAAAGGAFASSFVNDFLLRSTGIANLYGPVFENFALGNENALWPAAARLYLRLNCLTEAYAPLWEEVTGEKWTMDTPLRNARDRWHAQNEIDAIVALSLGITADELCMIYRTQFPVMQRYDREDLFDANGRKVAGDVVKLQKKLKGDAELSVEDRTWTHPQSGVEYTFEYPFAPLDREADLRAAYARYEKEL